MNSKSLVNCFVQNRQYFEKFANTHTFLGRPQEFCHGFMYIALSSGHSLMTLTLPIEVNSKEV